MSNHQFTKDCTVTEAPVTTDTYARFIDFYGDAPRHLYHLLCEAGKWTDGTKRQVFYGTDPKPDQFNKLTILGNMQDNPEKDGGLLPSIGPDRLEEVKPVLRRIHAYLGILSELAELALPDLLAFRRWADGPTDVRYLTFEEVERYTYGELGLNPEVSRMEEGGDICWYLGILLDACRKEGTVPITIESLCGFVIAKLQVRYKDKFDKAETEQRNVELELAKGLEGMRTKVETLAEIKRRGIEAARQVWPEETTRLEKEEGAIVESLTEPTAELVEAIKAMTDQIEAMEPAEVMDIEPVVDPMADIENQWRQLFTSMAKLSTPATFQESVTFVLANNTPQEIQRKVTKLEEEWGRVTNVSQKTEMMAALRYDILVLFAHISNQRDRIAELTSRLDSRTTES
jgi:hypothetical protein